MKAIKRIVSKQIFKNLFLKVALGREELLLKQEENFIELKNKLRGTSVYNDFNLEEINSYSEFIDRVEPSEFNRFSSYVERLTCKEDKVIFNGGVKCFGLTSGTSGQDSKRVPYNKEMIDLFKSAQRYQASVINNTLRGVDLVNSSRISYGSTPKNYTVNGIQYGYISGILSAETPRVLKKVTFPSLDILEIEDWDEKLDLMVKQCLSQDMKIASGIPTYLITIFEEVLKRTGKKYISEVWPNLETVIYGATAIDSYKEKINELVGRRLNYFGVYASTEAPIGIGINNAKNEKQIYSFHPELIYSFTTMDEKRTLDFSKVVEGEEYLLNITTPNGFLNYTMKDIVKIKSLSPIVTFEIMGRKGSGINLGAEKTTDQQVLDTIVKFNQRKNVTLDHYFLSPSIRNGKSCYQWTLFSNQLDCDVKELEEILDETMSIENADYKDCRDSNIIEAPVVKVIRAEFLEQYFEQFRDKGQFKMKTVFSDSETFQGFIESVFPNISKNFGYVA